MAVFRIALTEDEQRVVNAERDSHPEAHVRRKMLVVWLLHCGLTRAKAAEIAGLSRPTVQRYVAAFRTGGLDGLRRWGVRGPVSDLVAHTAAIREALTNRPVRTAAEAAEQIEHLTGLKRQPTQIRQVPESGTGVPLATHPGDPVPAQERLARSHPGAEAVPGRPSCSPGSTRPLPDGGRCSSSTRPTSCSGRSCVACGRWRGSSCEAASGRQRFNVLGAWNAVTRELITITNTTVVNTETMCELLRTVAARGWSGRSRWCWTTPATSGTRSSRGWPTELGIELLFLPSYSPNLNLIERLWRFVKRKAAYGRYHPTFADFRAAVQDVLDRVPTTHAEKLASLMTLNFQEFDDVSLLAA